MQLSMSVANWLLEPRRAPSDSGNPLVVTRVIEGGREAACCRLSVRVYWPQRFVTNPFAHFSRTSCYLEKSCDVGDLLTTCG